MYRLSNGSQVASLPTPAADVGTPGYATNGIVGSQLGSVIDADQFNIHQEELMAILAAASISADKTNNAQVLAAINSIIAAAVGAVRPGFSQMQVFTASGNFTVPAGVTKLRVRCVGGGGGGGYGGSSGAGAGGGGGGFGEGIYTVTPAAVIAVTTGAAGAGGTSSSANGGGGGTSAFGALLSATGGAGGNSVDSGFGAAVAGGASAGAILALNGYPSGSGIQFGTSFVGGAGGGVPAFAAQTWVGTTVGAVGVGRGGGGGGGSNGNAGGAGSAGIVIVEW